MPRRAVGPFAAPRMPIAAAFALLFAFSLVGQGREPLPRLDYPLLGSLGPEDGIFRQQQEEVAAAYGVLGYLPAVGASGAGLSGAAGGASGGASSASRPAPGLKDLIFYVYPVKGQADLFSLAARLNLPYETLATLNRLDRSRGFISGDHVLVPSAPGIFCPEVPKSDLEILLSYREEGASIPCVVEGRGGRTAYRFFPGARFSAEERALFLGYLFRFPLPAARVTSGFGLRQSPVSGKTSMHAGVDLAAPEGTEVYAAREGRVSASGLDPALGEYVTIEHEGGYSTVYGHLSRRFVRLNEAVESGMIIGRVGSTGLSTGPHLHFEVRNRGEARDPELLIPKGKR